MYFVAKSTQKVGNLPKNFNGYLTLEWSGVWWPSGLAYRTQVLVLAAECGFESRP